MTIRSEDLVILLMPPRAVEIEGIAEHLQIVANTLNANNQLSIDGQKVSYAVGRWATREEQETDVETDNPDTD